MTKQIPDKVLYEGQEFILAGLKGNGLFKPIDFGISPEKTGFVTACYRGYFCKYECTDRQLFLVELSVLQSDRDNLPLIDDVSAQSGNAPFPCYQNLKVLCPLSGGLVIVREPAGSVGHFPSPIEFLKVVELTFEHGLLQSEIDHSAQVAELRQRVYKLRELHRPDNNLLTALGKWSSSPEKLSKQERETLDGFTSDVQNIHKMEWSFVSDYEQQPEVRK